MQQAIPSASVLPTKVLGFRDWRICYQTRLNLIFPAAVFGLANYELRPHLHDLQKPGM
jgi:hypothetical protein